MKLILSKQHLIPTGTLKQNHLISATFKP